ncbi:MAG: TonB-dependent receptor domain-containing protein [Terriglobia bacterium]
MFPRKTPGRENRGHGKKKVAASRPQRTRSAPLLLVAFLLSLSSTGLLLAETHRHSISGRVTGPQGIPLVAASVKLFGANRILIAEVRTNEEGEFSLTEVAKGRYELRVEASGFSPFQRVIDVPLEPPEPLEINLRLTPVELEVTVTGRHGAPEEAFFEPASVRIRGSQELVQREVSHLPRMLAEEPGILTQETTPGQGSPILRGQGAQTVLYLVDGIRFNNSTYRSGNTQYLGWMPSSSVDSVEVFLGPAGTQYGSDALGGAINVMSALLPPWSDTQLSWGGESTTFFTSADLGAGNALRATVAGRTLSLLVTGSYKRHQELRAGGGEDSHNSLTRFLGFSPAQVRATLGSRLRDTDYTQGSWSAKLGLRLRSDQFLTFSWIQSEQYGVRRYDRLLGGEGRLRSDLLPQRLSFGYVRYQKLGTGRLQNLEATVSLNRQTDGQISQVREASPRGTEVNRVTALGYLFSTSWAPLYGHSLAAGVEFYDEYVFGKRTESTGGVFQQVRPRFPNGTRYQSLGVYVLDDWAAIPSKLLVESGLRFSHFRFRSRSDKNVFLNGVPTVPDATESFTDLTFNAGLSYSLVPSLVVFGRVARGFRAPTVFDLGEQGLTGGGFEVSPRATLALGALIGDSAGSNAVSTGRSWQALRPEVLWSFEGGLRWKTQRVNGNLTLFDSEFVDSIQRRVLIVPTPVVGQIIGNETITDQDATGRIFVDLDFRPVVSRANIGRIRIQGLEAWLRVNWSDEWSSAFKTSRQRGRELATRNFARRIAPDTLFASLRWNHRSGRFWLEGFTEISGAQTRLNPAELNDPRIGAVRTAETIADFFNFGARRLGLVAGDRLQRTGETVDEVIARVLGPALAGKPLFQRTDGFVTLNLRGAYILNEKNEILFALTNITDANYRKHGSGFDAAGVNFSVRYRWKFR